MNKKSKPNFVGFHSGSRINVALAIDLGGTNLRMGIVKEMGEVVKWKKQTTPSDNNSIILSIQELVKDGFYFCNSDKYNVIGVGISTGGRVDFKRGIIIDSTALISGWKNVSLKKIIEKKFSLPTYVDNDGNCFAIAEKRFGKGERFNNFIAVVLGTGIGGGIYVDGKLLRGSNNFASEIGHVSVNAEGPQCSCGGRGCIELYASGSGISRWASENPQLQHLMSNKGEISSKIISKAARDGDKSASNLLKAAGWKLGVAMSGLVNVFNPESIILSGSLLKLEHTYLDEFKKTVMDIAMKSNTRELRIKRSDFPQEGGILGAAALVFEEVSNAFNSEVLNASDIDKRKK